MYYINENAHTSYTPVKIYLLYIYGSPDRKAVSFYDCNSALFTICLGYFTRRIMRVPGVPSTYNTYASVRVFVREPIPISPTVAFR